MWTPPFRRHGLGLQLVGQAAAVYRGMGRTLLQLQCAPNNLPAQSLYRQCGFFKTGQAPGIAGPVDVLALHL